MRYMQSFAAAAALVLAVGATAPALADLYDTPTSSVVRASRTSVTLEVRAGATGAPSGFAVEWMTKAAFDLYGWDPDFATLYYCTFYDAPTLNLQNTPTYKLGAYQSAWVEVGDLFDETGMVTDYVDEMWANDQFVFRAYAVGDANGGTSYYSNTAVATTLTSDSRDCTFTQGYWKTHGAGDCHSGNNPDVWPVNNLTLGNVNYTATQLCCIFNKNAGGNGLVSMAHQLIAAKLNIANGASVPPAVAAVIAAADAQIGNLVIPSDPANCTGGAGSLPPGQTSSKTQALDEYNNGTTGPGHCDTTPTRSSTWGVLKVRYR